MTIILIEILINMSYIPAIGTAYGTFLSILTVKLWKKFWKMKCDQIIDSEIASNLEPIFPTSLDKVLEQGLALVYQCKLNEEIKFEAIG